MDGMGFWMGKKEYCHNGQNGVAVMDKICIAIMGKNSFVIFELNSNAIMVKK